MAGFRNISNNYSPSSCLPQQQEPDEISLFLQQILMHSSSSSPSLAPQQTFGRPSDHPVAVNQEPVVVPGPGRIYVPERTSGMNSSSSCSFTPRTAANASSSIIRNKDREPDEYDYESEEAVEAFVEETAPILTPPRSSSKRSRAAEVHNLSEKRRRSRINEKMKALQNLIPNSNKTDKASMLDEAIEYLKQLQLQVQATPALRVQEIAHRSSQMLTLRNGLSLYPVCLPGMAMQPNQYSQMRIDMRDRDNKSLNVNMGKAIAMDQNISTDALVSMRDGCVKQAPVADFSTMMDSKSRLELESSVRDHLAAFQFTLTSKERTRRQNEDYPETSLKGNSYCLGGEAASSAPFEKGSSNSNSKESNSEAPLAQGDRLLANFANDPIVSSQLNM